MIQNSKWKSVNNFETGKVYINKKIKKEKINTKGRSEENYLM